MWPLENGCGSPGRSFEQLADRLPDRLGAAFADRDSGHPGICPLAALNDATPVQVQPIAITGGDGELYDGHTPTCPRSSWSPPRVRIPPSNTDSQASKNSPGSPRRRCRDAVCDGGGARSVRRSSLPVHRGLV